MTSVAQVVELRPRARQDFTASLGMIIFLGSWAMMFGALFFAYAFVRSRSIAWPPPGAPPLPIVLPAINTAVLLGSSFTFARGIKELGRGHRRRLTAWVGATLVLGVVFLALQLLVWQAVGRAGLSLESGTYGAIFYTLTTFHAVHVAVGLGILLWVLGRSWAGKYTEHNYVNVRLCAMFWHFVNVVWVLMFLSLYLV